MRIPLIAGNWKLNKNRAEAEALARGVVEATRDVKNVEILLCPVFTCWKPWAACWPGHP